MKPNNYLLCKTNDPLTTTTGFEGTYKLFLFGKNHIIYNLYNYWEKTSICIKMNVFLLIYYNYV